MRKARLGAAYRGPQQEIGEKVGLTKETDESTKGPLCSLFPSTSDQARHILDIAEVILIALSIDGTVAMINRRGCELLGYSEAEILGQSWFEAVIPTRFREQVRQTFKRIISGELEPVKTYDNPIVDRQGQEHDVTWSNTLLFDSDGAIVGTLSSGLDMTEQRRAEQARLESEQSLRALIDTARDAIVIVGESGRIIYINRRAANVSGHPVDELVDQPATDLIWPEDRNVVEHHLRAHLEGRSAPFQFECRLRSPEGEAIPVEISSSTTRWRGRRSALVIIRDITEHKSQQEGLKRRLREKETLLTEVHHRVKNNLQIVSGLLEIQADSFTEEVHRQRIMDIQNRVQSMALVHEKLYQAADLARISARDFLAAVAKHQCGAFSKTSDHVELELEIADIALSVETAIPCGLLVSELVSNALKHAFSAQWRSNNPSVAATIAVTLQPDGESILLIIKDSGCGLPLDIEPSTSPSLGLQLVDSLVGQLGGSLEIQRYEGTEVVVRFGGSG